MFVSLSSFFAAILNSHNKFAAASAAPIILNIVLISILFFGKFLNDELVYYLSYGVSIAGILQLVFLYQFTKKFYSIQFSFNFKINHKVKFFFRKPERKNITDKILSPCDGVVTKVDGSDISIFLSLLDVHWQYVPINSKIKSIETIQVIFI